ncbi:MAG: ATP-binding protein, partial [Actinomycetes bacterium]
LQALEARLTPSSLITLVGPGGVGKTSLGRSLASQLRGRFRDGCLSIDLTVIRNHEELTAVIGHVAQISEVTTDNLPELLRGLDALLLLDDADELVPEVASLCAALNAAGSRITVLVTCRERLGVAGEQIWPVLPLSDEDAVELLVRKATELAPLGSLVTADRSEVSNLARSVDHLPLVLEMLASASAYLGIAELSDLVTAHPELLTDPRRDAPSRHKSLDLLLTDSLARLDSTEREALTAASTFAGPFRLSDAAALIDRPTDALSIVRRLIDRSLLSPSISGAHGPRFQMLRTVSRAVGRTADSTLTTLWRRKHAEWVADELREADITLRSADEREGSRRFVDLADDARLAHSWARDNDISLALDMTAALQLYAHSRLWAEPAQWAQSIQEWREHGRAVAAAASQASQEGRFDDAWNLGQLALQDSDERVRAWALEVLSDVALYVGRLQDAENHASELVSLGVRIGDPRLVALGTTNGALARVYAGRPTEALEVIEKYPGDGPRSEVPTDAAWLEYAAGEALATAGRTAEALEHLQRSNQLGEQADSRFVAGIAQSTVAGLQFRAGDLTAAAHTYSALISTFRRHGIITHLTISLRNTVHLLSALGADQEAATLAGWVLGARARPGYGPDLDELVRTREALRGQHGDEAVTTWEAKGALLTASEATDVALHVLERIDGHECDGTA